jgi:hypothetical protein
MGSGSRGLSMYSFSSGDHLYHLLKHGDLDPAVLSEFNRLGITSIGVAHDARARVAGQHPLQAAGGFGGAVCHGEHQYWFSK